MSDESILSPDKQLRNIKLDMYFNLLQEKEKYVRLSIYRKTSFSMTNWILALLSFFDCMFDEIRDDKFSKKYKVCFERIETLNSETKITYSEILHLTTEMMKFASETGITRISKYEESPRPGGALYDGH